MLICFQFWIFAWWCAEWERDLLGAEAESIFIPSKPYFSSSFLFHVPSRPTSPTFTFLCTIRSLLFSVETGRI